MARLLTLVGAYGKQYHDAESAKAAWNKGVDFKILNGPYCSIRDIRTMVRLHETVQIRYGEGQLLTIYAYNKLIT